VLLEARTVAWAASGRNGGFCSASLTHGLANGLQRFGGEIEVLERLGRRNLDEIGDTIARHRIDCGFERTGELTVATQDWQVAGLRDSADAARALGHQPELLDRDGVRAEINSPAFLGGLWDAGGCALVDPARLAWGLRRACLDAGVCTPPAAACSPPGPRWAPARTTRCCAGSALSSSLSTTTC
jgi:glycine/D-amino acid oxidase-like deaminating enzyme